MDITSIVNFYLIPGIVIGSVYALGAIGITLVFAIMRHAHLAHGDMAALGAYIAFAVVAAFGVSPYLALPVAIVATGILAVAVDKLFYEHLRNRPKILTTISSLGIGLMLRSVVQIVWGVGTTTYATGITRPNNWYGFRVKTTELITLGSTIAIVILLTLFLTRTKWGKAMRAMSDNRNLALLSGIDNGKVVALTWLIVGGLCAASGFFLGINTELKSMMGWNIILPVFAAAVVGGVGRIEGAIAGGLIIGIIEEFSVMVIPTEYKAVSSFAVLLLVLLVRPTGIFRGKVL
ncbi:branched-chain amino acid ABC transporter permease [Rhizobium sp. B230/85]|uniref:branched-chain amino acid ABC transporter permease n=1 Tax=unclassified Rhizobium TaxID=2613769 RepID=UPI001ADA40FB|nr:MULTISPECIES: branched-chain amino acid ABC transporter permease [unclassified Rhizobium]MBO9136449.1 branched-chain amino acid ABC transporter permease [Rhizobium sp. B209b/85]QXZ98650.1 branched-chain amino acid ABC transporter permease [Rhizobium sp. B230/85]